MAIASLAFANDESFKRIREDDFTNPCCQLTCSERLYDLYGGGTIRVRLQEIFEQRFESPTSDEVHTILDILSIVIKYDLNTYLNSFFYDEPPLDAFFHPRAVATRNAALISDFPSFVLEQMDKIAIAKKIRRNLLEFCECPEQTGPKLSL